MTTLCCAVPVQGIDRIIEPHRTREELIAALEAANQGWDYSKPFKTGVLQT